MAKLHKFSVCVPTHRINKRLENTLACLKNLDYLKDFYEINLFLDGIADDSKFEGVNTYSSIETSSGPARAKNLAIAKAKYEWVVLVDSDDFLVPSALNQLNTFLNSLTQEQLDNFAIGFEPPYMTLLKSKENEWDLMFPLKSQKQEFYKENNPNKKTKKDFLDLNISGRPILFKKENFIEFDNKYTFAEDRKVLYDNIINNKPIWILPTMCYIFNSNIESISKGINFKEDVNNLKSKEAIKKEVKKYVNSKTWNPVFELFQSSDDYYLTTEDLMSLEDFKIREQRATQLKNISINKKRVVLTIAAGDFYQDLSKITHPTLKAYADRIKADFIVWTETKGYQPPHYKKLEIKKLLDEYERILFIDTDILIRDDAPDLFDIVKEDELGIFEEGQFTDRYYPTLEFMAQVGFDPKKWDKKYYNTGVMVISQSHKELFELPPIQVNHFGEQTYLNVKIAHHKPKINNLSYKYNRMSCMDEITGEDRHDCYFMHYAGVSVYMSQKDQLIFMKKDLEVWKKDSPNYKYKKNIAVQCEGGMGDQICAEPTCRFIIEQVYKNDNVIILSHWPELFKHLGVPTYKPGDKVENPKGFHVLHTLRTPEHESWEYMSHPLVNAVNFASMQALRLELPLEYKQFRLSYDLKDLSSLIDKFGIKDLKEYVLLHPGRGWPSKTFPKDIWQSWADILVNKGYKVAVIGKRIGEDQGIVEFDTSRCLDLIDKLSVSELVALISQAKVLITNDSAPLHIAGAFDNWIGIAATCKHPHYILPYRNGSIFHKVKLLEKDRMYLDYNNQPTQVYGARIDACTEKRMRQCLPSAEDILNFVNEVFQK